MAIPTSIFSAKASLSSFFDSIKQTVSIKQELLDARTEMELKLQDRLELQEQVEDERLAQIQAAKEKIDEQEQEVNQTQATSFTADVTSQVQSVTENLLTTNDALATQVGIDSLQTLNTNLMQASLATPTEAIQASTVAELAATKTVLGTSAQDVLLGSDANELFLPGAGKDTILAEGGNDRVVWEGKNLVDGGDGFDAVIVSDRSADLTTETTSMSFLPGVELPIQTAGLRNVELIKGQAGLNQTVTADLTDGLVVALGGDNGDTVQFDVNDFTAIYGNVSQSNASVQNTTELEQMGVDVSTLQAWDISDPLGVTSVTVFTDSDIALV